MPMSISRQLSEVGALRATLSVGGGVRVGPPASPRTAPDGEALLLGAMDSPCTGAVALGDAAAEAVGKTLPVGEAVGKTLTVGEVVGKTLPVGEVVAVSLGESDSLWTGALALGDADAQRVPTGVACPTEEWSLLHRTKRSPVPRRTTRSLLPSWPATVVQTPLVPNDQSKL